MAEVTNEEANELADEILGRSEFIAAREPGFFERSVNRVIETISDFLGAIFGAIFGGGGGAAGTTLAVILLALAVAVLAIAIFKAITEREPSEDDDDEGGPRIVFDEVVEPNQLQQLLREHRSAGDWRPAVIAGFRLAVVGLIDARIAREVAGATTGDFATAVERRRPELLATYNHGAAAFERAFYSDLAITEQDMGDVDALLARLQSVGSS